jgi:hypothetical protein
VLTPDDLDSLERLGIAASAALLLDLGGIRGEGETNAADKAWCFWVSGKTLAPITSIP